MATKSIIPPPPVTLSKNIPQLQAESSEKNFLKKGNYCNLAGPVRVGHTLYWDFFKV
jgi:hypothetical protein